MLRARRDRVFVLALFSGVRNVSTTRLVCFESVAFVNMDDFG